MLYMKCPSCGHLFADIQLEYEEKRDAIINNKSYSSEKKTKLHAELLNELYITNPCCTMRVMSYIQEEKILVP
jgi:DNA-directed RNA polymerase subunit N (RpoN/RPB10)